MGHKGPDASTADLMDVEATSRLARQTYVATIQRFRAQGKFPVGIFWAGSEARNVPPHPAPPCLAGALSHELAPRAFLGCLNVSSDELTPRRAETTLFVSV